MKKILFVCSHLHSGSTTLCSILNAHPKIQSSQNFRATYIHPENLIRLANQKHKLNNRSSIYMDELLFNYQLSIKVAYKECKFIYVVREPENVLNLLVSQQKMKPSFAIRYYTYRLRRLCEMAKRTPGAVLLTSDDLKYDRGMNLIEEYLNLKIPIEPVFQEYFEDNEAVTDLIERSHLLKAEEIFQRYLYYLKNQNLLQP